MSLEGWSGADCHRLPFTEAVTRDLLQTPNWIAVAPFGRKCIYTMHKTPIVESPMPFGG
jgi:hypothetical protein